MKKALAHTKVAVKLRKSEYRDEWYLYVESYPVFEKDGDKPQRIREYLNRSITTPLWDKNSKARTGKDGKTSFRPKRDQNGIIQCRSKLDQESCVFADNVRNLRQHEYDTEALYTTKDAEMAEYVEKGGRDFIEYFEEVTDKRHSNSSQSIIINWNRVHALLLIFTEGKPLPFNRLNTKVMEDFRQFLLTAPQGGNKSGKISQNTASTYFSIFKAGVKQAFVDGYLTVDLSAKVKGIESEESRREYLTIEELNKLAATPCDNEVIKKAALFSALTSMRLSDITKLRWIDIVCENGRYKVNFKQKKTKREECQPISEQAYKLCGERDKDPKMRVFKGLPAASWISKPLKRWIEAAGITKHITFHCFRHSFATNQMAEGTDLYTIMKMMGHTNIRTTQIYTKLVDKKKTDAADAIKLDI